MDAVVPGGGDARRRPRGPAALHGAVVVVLLALVATIALHAPPPAPPQIAEFAPQPQKQITQAPQGQSSRFGNGATGRGVGGSAASPTPTPTAPPTPTPQPVLAQFPCYGSPPRQTPDPQSPPCVPSWSGNNGGQTSHGVNAQYVCIGAPNSNTPTVDQNEQFLANYFNGNFNFYGRHIMLVPEPNTDNSQDVVSGEISNAKQAGTANSPCGGPIFASMPYVGSGSTTGWSYDDQLAQMGVISVAERPMFTNAVMDSRAPYLWQYNMAFDDQETLLGQMACAQLAGANASHAGEADFTSQPRKFGIIIGGDPDEGSYHSDPAPIVNALARCGVTVPAAQIYDFHNNSKGDPRYCSAAELQMKNAGVTTVISVTEIADTAETAQLAAQGSYFPEWVVPTYSFEDIDWWIQNLDPQNERQSFMGLSVNPKQVLPSDDPFFQALSQANPGAAPPPQSTYATYRDFYHDMLLPASGIQMAGPDLTPQSFAHGLQTTRFPNPDTRIRAGHVGFGPGQYAMTIDAAEMWWSNGGTPPYSDETGGAWCYVNQGQRVALGAVPATRPDPFDTGACDSGSSPGG